MMSARKESTVMTWAKLDDSFPEHPKVVVLSDAAFRVHVTALCYCARLLTDGFVPTATVRTVKPKILRELLADLWEPIEGGYIIHDYLDWNGSKASVLDRRRKGAERKERWEERQKNAGTDAGVTRYGTRDGTRYEQRPVPSSPVPEHKGALVVDDQQRYLADRLAETVDEAWEKLTDSELLSLSNDFGTSEVRYALRHAWEDKVIVHDPIGWVVHVCREDSS